MMVRTHRLISLAVAIGALASSPASAIFTCQPLGATSIRPCDVVCGSTPCTPPSPCDIAKSCDGTGSVAIGTLCIVTADCGGGNCVVDGCTICGLDYTPTINGTNNADRICTGGQGSGVTNKVVLGKDGNDIIAPGIVKDGNTVVTTATVGPMRVDGGDGDDTILTGQGDDIVFGGKGNDFIVTFGGRNLVRGGNGNDLLWGTVFGASLPADDDVGSIYCGDADDDDLIGWGARHMCMDGGDGNDTCSHVFGVTPSRAAESTDIGTFRNCENVTNTKESCNCEGAFTTD